MSTPKGELGRLRLTSTTQAEGGGRKLLCTSGVSLQPRTFVSHPVGRSDMQGYVTGKTVGADLHGFLGSLVADFAFYINQHLHR